MAYNSTKRSIRIICITLAFLACSGAIFPQGQPSKKERKQADDLFKEAEKSFAQKNYRNAIDQYGQSVAIVSANPQAHLRLAYSNYYVKDYDKALAELDVAATQGVKPLDISRLRYYLRMQKQDYNGALADIHELLKVEPNNAEFVLAEADINSALGDDKSALDAYQRAVTQNPTNGNLYYKIATLQAKVGNTTGQVSAAEEAIKRNTQSLGDAYYLAADGYFKLKRYDEAEQAYTRAIDRWKAAGEKSQKVYDAYRQLSDIYRRMNRFNDAIRVTKQAIVDFPNNGTLYTDASWFYSLADRNQDAIDAAKAGIQFSQNDHLPYTNLCRAYNDAGQYPLAVSACNAALKITPDDGETYFYLGRAYDLTNKPSEATKAYDRAVKGLEKFTSENPDYSDGFYLLGNAYFADEQPQKAIAAYQKCLELSPRFVKARFNLAIIYARSKNKPAAMEQYNSLLAIDPTLAAKLKTEVDKY
jgi:tetratricopeptide (TPR) repeat protein